jgi:hypothetical protein
MNLDRAVMRFAGCVILLSLLLAVAHSQWWLLLTAFAGINLIQSSFTGFCPVVFLFKRMGIRPGNAFE